MPYYRKRKSLFFFTLSLTLLFVVVAITAAIDVGTGAPNAAITGQFQNAFYRNGFAYLVSLPPAGPVTRFGSTGLIQEFDPAGSNSGNNNSTTNSTTNSTANITALSQGRLALVESNLTGATVSSGPQVAQVSWPQVAQVS